MSHQSRLPTRQLNGLNEIRTEPALRMKEGKNLRHGGVFLLTGISLIGFAFCGPDAAGRRLGAFFQMAASAPWNQWFNWPAAWCSCTIILLSLGLFLVIEWLGTWLVVTGRRRLAWTAYALHLLPALGFLTGGYCLIKALL